METRNCDEITAFALDMGAVMLMAGAEIYRVEDTIMRVLVAYGATCADVFAVPSVIVVTASFEDGKPLTQSRRILRNETNLYAVHLTNSLARRVCASTLSPEDAKRELKEILVISKPRAFTRISAFTLIPLSFTLFFGGTPLDGIWAALTGLILYYTVQLTRRTGGNPLFTDILASAVCAACALIPVKFGVPVDAELIIIGNVMSLIPGVELTNGMRDFIAGDILAGIVHLFEAIFLASGIAIGAAGTLALIGGMMG